MIVYRRANEDPSHFPNSLESEKKSMTPNILREKLSRETGHVRTWGKVPLPFPSLDMHFLFNSSQAKGRSEGHGSERGEAGGIEHKTVKQ